jgi:hypothetical protein
VVRGPRMPYSLLLGAIILVATGATARAQAGDPIAIMPLEFGSERLAIYGKPVADALATRLRGGGYRVEAVTGTPSPRTALVIDGSILTSGDDRVMLEARIRDPDIGRVVASVSTGYRALTEIDRLAAELAAALADELAAALEARARRARAEAGAQGPIVLPEAVVHGRFGRAPLPGQPPMLVYAATGAVAQGNVPVDAPATRAAHGLAAELGYRPVAADRVGPVAPAEAAAAMTQAGAPLALMIEVQGVDFGWHGVLTAGGRVRFMVIDRAGQVLYDRIAATDTVVGSRGDRHAALVSFVARQAAQIAAPGIARALEPGVR